MGQCPLADRVSIDCMHVNTMIRNTPTRKGKEKTPDHDAGSDLQDNLLGNIFSQWTWEFLQLLEMPIFWMQLLHTIDADWTLAQLAMSRIIKVRGTERVTANARG